MNFKSLILTMFFFVNYSYSTIAQTHINPDIALEAKSQLALAIETGEIEGGMILVHANGKKIMLDIQGYHDIEDQLPFKESSLIRIYSMTKPITSAAAMTLWEEGKFKLDDPVSKYIPSFKNAKVGKVERPFGRMSPNSFEIISPEREITVRDLLTHSAGYTYGGADYPNSPFAKGYRNRGVTFWGPENMFPPKMSIQKAAQLLSEVPLRHEPGERWTYGLNTDIVGALIEIWSGMELGEYFKESIFKPLGMKDTFFKIPEEKMHRFTSCHLKKETGVSVIDKWNSSPYRDGFEFQSGGGGLVSTIQDYAKFSIMLANWGESNGKRILEKSTLEKMFEKHFPIGDEADFGLGFAIEPVVLGNNPKAQFEQYGWSGYAGTWFRVIPESNISMIFMRQGLPYSVDFAESLFETIRKGIIIE